MFSPNLFCKYSQNFVGLNAKLHNEVLFFFNVNKLINFLPFFIFLYFAFVNIFFLHLLILPLAIHSLFLFQLFILHCVCLVRRRLELALWNLRWVKNGLRSRLNLYSDPLLCARLDRNLRSDSKAYGFIELVYVAANHSYIRCTRGLENIYNHLTCTNWFIELKPHLNPLY